MRVLIAHRWYGTSVPSGEDRAVEEDIRELTAAGIEVLCALPEQAGPSLGGLPPSSPYARISLRAIAENGGRLLDRFRPDLVHLHNPYPMYMGLVHALRKRHGVPLVHTIHNLRHVCPAGTAFRDGVPCEDCATQPLPVSCARHRCVSDSLVKSAAMGVMVRVSGRRVDAADVRIAVSDFMRSRLTEYSRPDDGRVVVLHNAVGDPQAIAARPTSLPSTPFVFFAGRLVETKGIDRLVEAAHRLPADIPLEVVVAGDGPLRSVVEQAAAASRSRIRFVGLLSSAEAYGYMHEAVAVAVPSVSDESFGLTVAESLGCATPVLATRRGALPEVVGECGVLVDGSVEDLTRGLAAVAIPPSDDVRRQSRSRWETHFSPAGRGPRLVEIYRSALDGLG